MTDDARLSPFSIAMYTATYPNAELAVIVARHLAREWRTPIAVIHADGEGFALYDLAEDPSGYIEHQAVAIAEPELNIADIAIRDGLL